MTATAEGAGAVEFLRSVVVKDGETTFTLSGPRPFFARLNAAHLVDADAGFEAGREYVVTRKLAAGLHELRITALTDDDGTASVSASVKSAGQK